MRLLLLDVDASLNCDCDITLDSEWFTMTAALIEDAVWSRLVENCGAPDLDLDAHNDLHKICDASEVTLR